MVLIDERARVRRLLTAGADIGADLSKIVRPDGISMQVIRTGQPDIIEDAHAQRNRHTFSERAGGGIERGDEAHVRVSLVN